jgi:NTP pyrophosphatase (non-canonical NTP hydrolase)
MDFNQYQQTTRKRSYYPNMGSNLIYPAMGLAGEAGEVANCMKKLMRDFGVKERYNIGEIIYKIKQIKDPEKRHKGFKLLWNLREEIGDCLWYCAALSSEMRERLESIAEINNIRLGFKHGAKHKN